LNIVIWVIEIYLPCEIRSNFCKTKIISQGKYFGACHL
jgi:hypothetical protein